MSDTLYACRLGYRALRLALEQYNLGDVVIHFNPDDPDQVVAGLAEGQVAFYEHFDLGRGKPSAVVLIWNTEARVVVERVDALIRRKHLADFRPHEIGINHRPGYADIDVTLDLAETMETEGELMRNARRRAVGTRPRPFEQGPPILGFALIK